ncbi:U-box domain-containing protein [Salix suchowensis]|nr:U-box domain-containing protein [Salix suchowensis]
MAVVSPVPDATTQQASPLTLAGDMENGREIVAEPVARVIEDKIFVAVGKSVKEYKWMLIWALQNSGGKRICIVHVHQPSQTIPLMGTKFLASALKEQEVRAYREIERQEMHRMLDEYFLLCRQMGVRAEKLYVEMESIEKGILELISQHGIRKLVMGAAADKRYSKNMMGIKSKKAISVFQQAPASCHIWFICKGHLIHTREGALDGTGMDVGSSSQQTSPSTEAGQSSHMRSQSIALGQNHYVKLTNPAQDFFQRIRTMKVDGRGGRLSISASSDGGPSTPSSRSDADGSSDEYDVVSRRSASLNSVFSPCSSSGMVNAALVPLVGTEGSKTGLELSILPHKEDLCQSSPPSVLDGSTEDPLFDQLERAMSDAENSRCEAFKEAARRAKAEKDAFEAMRKARKSENLYTEESKRRKEVEEELAKEKEELERINRECDELMKELHIAEDQKSLLEKKIEESDQMVKELEQKIISAVGLLQNYKKERDELQKERDIALIEAEELRRSQTETSGTHMFQFFSEISFSEIEEATQHFDPSLKIGEGGYGSIFKGVLRQTQVAVKMLHSNSLQGPAEFQQEVDVLSRMRHPNLITLVGACPEAWTLIYEYLPNGSLEDRLSCRDNTPPLSWQTRIRIAAELCSALIFLHSSKQQSIVHGDLKPANILLDENFVTKLSDFGICRLLYHKEGSSNNTTICRTDPKGTFTYMDPEFLSTGELTPKSDVYSFGIILLRLLTAREALGITKDVQSALDKGNLKTILDPLAGDWPFVQAEQLAHLALWCCELSRKNRPDLVSEVWRVLEPMRASCGGSSFFQLGSEEHFQPPSYFICPIFQEVMRDPHVAADGYTYEAEALKGWLDSGHDTSPMTNLKLAHCDLIPNHALRSAIQEWLQQQ